MPWRAVTFDVGGTLIEPWPSVGHVYASEAAQCGQVGLDPDLLSERFGTVWKSRTRFDHSRRAWAEVVRATFEGLIPRPDSPLLFDRIYHRFSLGAAWRVHPDVEPCLQELSRAGLRLGVISNFDERLRPLLIDLRLDRYFEVVLASGPIGIHKPSPEIFLLACRRLGARPAEAVHIGDVLAEDGAGAESAGLRFLHLRRRAAAASCGPGQITTLSGVSGALEVLAKG